MPEPLPVESFFSNTSTYTQAADTDSQTVDPSKHSDQLPNVTVVQTSRPGFLPVDAPEIPGYEVKGEIARGGMGRVLAARDLTLERVVAIKILLVNQSVDSGIQRFIREAKITAKLPHPGIPAVHQLGILPGGFPFLAMKLIQGRTLSDELKDRSSPAHDLPRFVQVFEQICQAVGYAHSQGIIHRDLKPANVMVGAFGEVQVMDWGLARENDKTQTPPDENKAHVSSGDSPSFETVAGAIMGTPPFMAPEQARGEPVDCRADVFALGAVLCDTLTGAPPFTGNSTAEVLKRAATGDVSDAFARLDECGCDTELVALARRCLSANPDERPLDGKAVADAVSGYRASVEARLRKAETERARAEAKAAEQRKRRRAQLALAVTVGLLLFSGIAFAWWHDKQATDREAERKQIENEKNSEAQRQQFEEEKRTQIEQQRLARNRTGVESLLGECVMALRSSDAPAATILLRLAEKQVSEGGADHLKGRLTRCRAELETFNKLDELFDGLWSPDASGIPDAGRSIKRLDGVFREFGLILGTTPTNEAVRRVQESAIHESLLAGLDLWLTWNASADLLAILQAADPDPFRNAVRAAFRAKDEQKLRELAERSEATEQPLRFIAGLNMMSPIQREASTIKVHQQLLGNPAARPLIVHYYMNSARLYNMSDRQTAISRIRCYETVIAIKPNNVFAWDGWGVALAQTNRHAEGAVAIQMAIQLSPKAAYFYDHLGCVLGDQGKWAEAIPRFQKALELEPKHPEFTKNLTTAHYQIGKQLGSRRDWMGAIPHFKEVVRLDPDADAHYQLAVAYEKTDTIDDAITHTRRAVELEKNSMKKGGYQQYLNAILQMKDKRDAKIAPPPREVRQP